MNFLKAWKSFNFSATCLAQLTQGEFYHKHVGGGTTSYIKNSNSNMIDYKAIKEASQNLIENAIQPTGV